MKPKISTEATDISMLTREEYKRIYKGTHTMKMLIELHGLKGREQVDAELDKDYDAYVINMAGKYGS